MRAKMRHDVYSPGNRAGWAVRVYIFLTRRTSFSALCSFLLSAKSGAAHGNASLRAHARETRKFRNYSDAQVLAEPQLPQNADDAGASHVAFMLDERAHPSGLTARLSVSDLFRRRPP
jgi:hypothetical protein